MGQLIFSLLSRMSAGKLMKRIITPDDIDYNGKDPVSIAREIHDKTYGISSDPLLLFSIVFAALIHDSDRRCPDNLVSSHVFEIHALTVFCPCNIRQTLV